jgi:hypothetical protein
MAFRKEHTEFNVFEIGEQTVLRGHANQGASSQNERT